MHLVVRRMKNAAIFVAVLSTLITGMAWGTTISDFSNVPTTKNPFIISEKIFSLSEKRELTDGSDEINGIQAALIFPERNPQSVDAASIDIFAIAIPESLLYQHPDNFLLSEQYQELIADLNDTLSRSDNSKNNNNKFNITKVVGEFTVESPRRADTIVLVPEPGTAFFILVGLTALMVRNKRR